MLSKVCFKQKNTRICKNASSKLLRRTVLPGGVSQLPDFFIFIPASRRMVWRTEPPCFPADFAAEAPAEWEVEGRSMLLQARNGSVRTDAGQVPDSRRAAEC